MVTSREVPASRRSSDLAFYIFRGLAKRRKKERKKTDNPSEGWEDGTPPPHRDFKEKIAERGVMR